MKLYLYRNRGDWCLEDPHYKTMLGDRIRHRHQAGKWSPELWYVSRWLNERQQGELRKIDPEHKLPQQVVTRMVRDFLQRQP